MARVREISRFLSAFLSTSCIWVSVCDSINLRERTEKGSILIFKIVTDRISVIVGTRGEEEQGEERKGQRRAENVD